MIEFYLYALALTVHIIGIAVGGAMSFLGTAEMFEGHPTYAKSVVGILVLVIAVPGVVALDYMGVP